jgi:methyl-accepting chemotaxis protein
MKQLITNLFSKLPLWQKFLILGSTALILLLIPLYFYVQGMLADIGVAKHEISGIKPSLALQKVVQLTQQHRDLSSLVLGGDTASASAREAKEKEVTGAIAVMDGYVKEINDSDINKSWTERQQQWITLLDLVKKSKASATQSINSHAALITTDFSIMDKISDNTELSLDPASDSYFMMRATLYVIPKLAEALSRTQALGGELLASKQADPAKVATLSSFVGLIVSSKEEAETQIVKTFNINPEVKSALESSSVSTFNQVNNAIKLAENEIVNKSEYSYDKKTYLDEFASAISNLNEMNGKAVAQLENIIEDRRSGLANQLLYVSIGLLTLFALALFIAFLITGSITGPIGHLVNVMQKLAGGDSSVRANMQTFDEVGLLGRQFDMMVDQRELVSAQVQRENDNLNDSVINILQAVAKLSQRDLTVQVPVSEDITGPVGDSLNQLTQETSRVLNQVKQIAGDVANASKQIKEQSDNVISVATEERRQVEQSANDLNTASEVMQDIAKLAVSCNEAAGQAIVNTDKAQATVLGTVQGITTIRDTIRETEKRIKRLGERSQEIGGVVSIINNIAERTHTLALNASMHAASAGEAGRGFAVVANEVQKLAENAREATSQISALVNNIQVETADTVTTMNDAITQVVQGTTLAQQAGNQMQETRDTTANLVELVQRIALNSKAQAETTQRLRDTALNIQKSSEQTNVELQNQGKQTERLVEFSGKLVESVGVFTLPAA